MEHQKSQGAEINIKKFGETLHALQQELGQSSDLRRPYLKAISEARGGRTVVSFFMSFYTRSPLVPEDADQLEEILCNATIDRGVTLLLDAPGGDGLTAERIIRICKKYSGEGDFETIIAARAKSAGDALRRAAAFPVRGGDVLPIKRKSWYPRLDQESRPRKAK